MPTRAHPSPAHFAALALPLLAIPSAAQTLLNASVDPAGVARGGAYPVLSATGRYVAFSSGASDLVPGDTNARWDVFLRDLELGTTTRVNLDSSGSQELDPDPSILPVAVAVSPDGRYVLFDSDCDALAANDSNGLNDAFLRDTWLGTTELVAVDSNGNQAIPPPGFPQGNYGAALTSDARYVLYTSDAANLAPGGGAITLDVFVRDRASGTTEIASLAGNGAGGNRHSIAVALTGDGRKVLFLGASDNLVPGDTNGYLGVDLFVRDLDLDTTVRVNVAAGGAQADDYTSSAAWSADGRWIAFSSWATNLVPGDTNAVEDVFVKDYLTGAVERVSVRSDGAQVGPHSAFADASAKISSDGRYVSFASDAPDLVPNDANSRQDVFVHDRATRVTERVSLDAGLAEIPADSLWPALAADARRVAFHTTAPLAGGDSNALTDVYVFDRGAPGPFATFCAGVASRCPCGNGGGTYAGCVNSLGTGGLLAASGTPSVASDTLELATSGLPPTAMCLYFQGTSQVGGGAGSAFGDGLRCVNGVISRLGTRAQTNGASTFGGGGQEPLVSSIGNVPVAGGTREYQAWYRNAAAYCTSSTFNLTNGIRVAWLP